MYLRYIQAVPAACVNVSISMRTIAYEGIDRRVGVTEGKTMRVVPGIHMDQHMSIIMDSVASDGKNQESSPAINGTNYLWSMNQRLMRQDNP